MILLRSFPFRLANIDQVIYNDTDELLGDEIIHKYLVSHLRGQEPDPSWFHKVNLRWVFFLLFFKLKSELLLTKKKVIEGSIAEP